MSSRILARAVALGLSALTAVSIAAGQTLLMHAMNDPTDDVRHSLAYGLALHESGVPVEMHLYAKGGHAFEMRPTSDPITAEWPKLAETWLHTCKVLEQPN